MTPVAMSATVGARPTRMAHLSSGPLLWREVRAPQALGRDLRYQLAVALVHDVYLLRMLEKHNFVQSGD